MPHANLWTCLFTHMPEGYQKGNIYPLSDLLTDPLTDPVIRAEYWSRPGDSACWKDTGSIPDHFGDLERQCSPGPAWSPVKLRNVHFTCTMEGYRKTTGRVSEFCQRSHGIALQLYRHAGRIPQ